MHGEAGDFIIQILALLGSAAVVSTLFYRLRIPVLLAFLLVGLALGPTGLQIVTDVEQLHTIAELGLVFLLFVLGLEFSFRRLIAMRHVVLRLGGAQVAICSLAFFVAFYWWGLSWQTAALLAGGLSLSSTAIVSRELSVLGQLHSRHGQIAIGVLLFQDLVAVGLLAAVPLLSGAGPGEGVDNVSAAELLFTIGKTVGLLALFFLFGRYVLPHLLTEVSRTRSDELLVLTALVVVLVAGVATKSIGLSMELGAFLAGMMLGESRFKHQLEADVRPFRDVLLGLFFISIGMLIDIDMLREYWFRILYSGVLLLLFKAIIITAVARLVGESWRAALPAGLALAQGGEFLFALLALATRDGLVANDVASFLLSLTIVSMALTPVLIRHSEDLVNFVLRKLQPVRNVPMDTSALSLPQDVERNDHVIILGFGRVGQTVARFLRQLDINYLALETDTVRIAEAVLAGEPVFYGDTARADILKAAGVEDAALLIISFDDVRQAQHILRVVKGINPKLPVLARTSDDAHLDSLIAAGAEEVVPETLEASLMLVSHVLLMLNVPSRRIHEVIDQARRNRYKMLHGFYHGQRTTLLGRSGVPVEFQHAVQLTEQAWACGKRLDALNWPVPHQPVTQVHRRGEAVHVEEFDDTLATNDIVMLIGTMEQIEACENYLLRGRR